MTDWLACLLTRPPRRRQIVKLKPEYYDKYKEVHAAVWPEVLRQIKACNIVDCRFGRSAKLLLVPRTRVLRGREAAPPTPDRRLPAAVPLRPSGDPNEPVPG